MNKKAIIIIYISFSIITGCLKTNIHDEINGFPPEDIFTETVITFTWFEKDYEFVLHADGTISGDLKGLTIVRYKSEEILYIESGGGDEYYYQGFPPFYNRWKIDEKKKSIIITNGKNTKYLKFFKNALIIELEPAWYDQGKRIIKVDYKADFSHKLPAVNLKDILPDEDAAYHKSRPFIRYINTPGGLDLRSLPASDSSIIAHMRQGDKFFIIDNNKNEPAYTDKNYQWNYGFWRGIKGWVCNTNLSKLPVENGNFDHSYEKFKEGRFPYFKTKIYELPDRSSRLIGVSINPNRLYYYTHKNMEPGWIYVEEIYSPDYHVAFKGCVEKDMVEEDGKIVFQKVKQFKSITYWGTSADFDHTYYFKTDGSCIKEDMQSNRHYKESFLLYKYKDIYYLKGGRYNRIESFFRFKNDIPCMLEEEDKLGSAMVRCLKD